MPEDFTGKLLAAVRERRRAPGRFLGQVAGGALRGGVGLATLDPREPAEDLTPLTAQLETLGELEGGVAPDVEKANEAKLKFIQDTLAKATQRLNEKAKVYSAAQYNRAKLQLDALKSEFIAVNRLMEPSSGGGGSDGTDLTRAISRLQLALASDPDSAETTEQIEAIASTLDAPARQVLFAKILDRTAFQKNSAALEPLETLGPNLPIVLGEIDAKIAAGKSGFTTDAEGGTPLRDARTAEMFNEDGTPTDATSTGLEYAATPGMVSARLQEMVTNLDSIGGSGGGNFAPEVRDILNGIGVSSFEEAFARYGSGDAEAARDSLREGYAAERRDLADRIAHLQNAPRTRTGRAFYEAASDPGFSQVLDREGFTDPQAGMRQLAKQAGRTLTAQRRDTRQKGRESLGPPVNPFSTLAEKKRRTRESVIQELGARLDGRRP